jgi:two-component sensor histidine kinase
MASVVAAMDWLETPHGPIERLAAEAAHDREPLAWEPEHPESLGLQIVGILTKQIGGDLTIGRSGGRTRFDVRFRVDARDH